MTDLDKLKQDVIDDCQSAREKLCMVLMFDMLDRMGEGEATLNTAKFSTEARGWLKAALSVTENEDNVRLREAYEAIMERHSAAPLSAIKQ